MDAEPSYTVTQLVTALRQALVALGPSFESTGVTWKDGEAYDEWDLTEEVLFEVLVASAVRGDLPLFASSRPFVPYGYSGVSFYSGSWVQVIAPGEVDTLALIRLNSPNGFGDIRAARLGRYGRTRGEVVVPWTPDIQFAAQLCARDFTLTRADTVTPIDSSVIHPRQRG